MINIWSKDCNHIEIPRRNSLHIDSAAVSSCSFARVQNELFVVISIRSAKGILFCVQFCFCRFVYFALYFSIWCQQWRNSFDWMKAPGHRTRIQTARVQTSPPPLHRSVAMFWRYWHFNPQNREKICTWYRPIFVQFGVDTVDVSDVVLT